VSRRRRHKAAGRGRWDGDPSERPTDIADDEHERWIREVGHLFLRDVELNSIGCPGSGATPEVGEQIHLWHRSSSQVWLEFGPREPYRLA